MPAVPPSTPPARPGFGILELLGVLFFALGAPRLDFFDFLVHREGVQKWWFFGIAPKRPKSDDKSNLGGSCRQLDPKTWLLRSPLASFFHCFFEWPKIKKSVCFSILFNGFGPSKTIDFPIVFSQIFHVF